MKKAIAYTDGSYNQTTKHYGYGVILTIIDNEEIILSGEAYDEYNGHQIGGEILAALLATERAISEGCESIEIRHDYIGVRCWATDEWRANKVYTIDYKKKMHEYSQKIKITYTHVKAHKGEFGNERVDSIAKKACGVLL